MYTDASGFAAGCHIMQIQEGEKKPLIYESFAFSKPEGNYDTYRRELCAIVKFSRKYCHMLRAEGISTIFTDHKPLTRFMNAEYMKTFLLDGQSS